MSPTYPGRTQAHLPRARPSEQRPRTHREAVRPGVPGPDFERELPWFAASEFIPGSPEDREPSNEAPCPAAIKSVPTGGAGCDQRIRVVPADALRASDRPLRLLDGRVSRFRPLTARPEGTGKSFEPLAPSPRWTSEGGLTPPPTSIEDQQPGVDPPSDVPEGPRHGGSGAFFCPQWTIDVGLTPLQRPRGTSLRRIRPARPDPLRTPRTRRQAGTTRSPRDLDRSAPESNDRPGTARPSPPPGAGRTFR